jgi:hypothetical protein
MKKGKRGRKGVWEWVEEEIIVCCEKIFREKEGGFREVYGIEDGCREEED